MIVTIENVRRAREVLRAWRGSGVEYFRCFEDDGGRQQCEPCAPDADPVVYKVPEEVDLADFDPDHYPNPISDDLSFKPATDYNPAVNAVATALAEGWEIDRRS